jgi:hypothetical protein
MYNLPSATSLKVKNKQKRKKRQAKAAKQNKQ